MNFCIIRDDLPVINSLESIIGSHDLGSVCSDSEGKAPNLTEIMVLNLNAVLVDFLISNVDGIQAVPAPYGMDSIAKCVTTSQISSKELIMKAHNTGVGFFINKSINTIEIKRVIENITRQIRMEQTLPDIHKAFQVGIGAAPATKKDDKDTPVRRLQYVLNRLDMSGEEGSKDIIIVYQYLCDHERTSMTEESIGKLCEILNNNPKSMEQRIRHVIARGMSDLANLGIENFTNDTFTRRSGTLFSFEGTRTEIGFTRGERSSGKKTNIKKLTNGLLAFMDQQRREILFQSGGTSAILFVFASVRSIFTETKAFHSHTKGFFLRDFPRRTCWHSLSAGAPPQGFCWRRAYLSCQDGFTLATRRRQAKARQRTPLESVWGTIPNDTNRNWP